MKPAVSPALLRGTWLALGWLQIVLIIYLSLTAHPPHGPDIPGFDKIGHCSSYGFLTFWFCQLYTLWVPRLRWAAAFVAMGVGLEFVQGWLGYRMFEYWDMVANTTGVLLGMGISRLSRTTLLARLQSR